MHNVTILKYFTKETSRQAAKLLCVVIENGFDHKQLYWLDDNPPIVAHKIYAEIMDRPLPPETRVYEQSLKVSHAQFEILKNTHSRTI